VCQCLSIGSYRNEKPGMSFTWYAPSGRKSAPKAVDCRPPRADKKLNGKLKGKTARDGPHQHAF
jgi:hypothetical protein